MKLQVIAVQTEELCKILLRGTRAMSAYLTRSCSLRLRRGNRGRVHGAHRALLLTFVRLRVLLVVRFEHSLLALLHSLVARTQLRLRVFNGNEEEGRISQVGGSRRWGKSEKLPNLAAVIPLSGSL